MDFLTDFISNNAVLLIALVTVLAFIAKLIISYVSKDKTVIVPASEIIDNVTEYVTDRIEDKHNAKELANPVVKEGFSIIKQPSNPNKDEDNSADDEGG